MLLMVKYIGYILLQKEILKKIMCNLKYQCQSITLKQELKAAISAHLDKVLLNTLLVVVYV